MTNYHLATRAVRSGYTPDATGSANLPIHPSTAFVFDDADHAADLFDLQCEGNIYSRINNPTMDAFSARVNDLDEGVGALAVSSGQAAIDIALSTIASQGDHILSVTTLYGGTHSLFSNTFRARGIEVTFIDPDASKRTILESVRPETKAIYAETIGNPRMNIPELDTIAQAAREADLPFVLDNTLATPALFRPKDHGVSVAVYSATKYLGGHGNALGGVIVDLGNYDWGSERFPVLNEPDPSYHGIRYVETFGKAAYIVRARVGVLRDVGSALSPFNAWVLSMGLETLPLRMKQHSENALRLARHLQSHPGVAYVLYPGLSDSPDAERSVRYLPNGASGMLAFGIRGGLDAGVRFINHVRLANHVTNLGDTRTIVTHPASTTHRQLSDQEQREAGVTSDMIRVSVGIEDIRDLIDDFDQALERAGGR